MGSWVRPLGNAESGELHSERLYAGYEEPKLLDVIEIEFLRERRASYRPEDCLVNASKKWVKNGTFPRGGLLAAVEQPGGGLWIDGYSSSYGLNDRIGAVLARNLTTTLKLVRPAELRMWVQIEGQNFGKPRRKVRGQFQCGTLNYIFAVTDPVVEQEFRALAEGSTKTLKDPILCLSVSEMFAQQNACYKLIAGVI